MTETLGKGGKRPACQTCGAPGFYLCDHPVTSRTGGPGRSCGRVMCKQHAHRVGGVAHYCPPHERSTRLPAAPAAKPGPRAPCPHSWYDPGCKCGKPLPPPEPEDVAEALEP